MRRAILNVACGSWYPRGQRRLKRTIEAKGEEADLLLWTNEYPKDSPNHRNNPYAFKPYAFMEALDRGYDQALWLDSSVMLCKPLTQVWEWTTEDGYCFGNDGWFVGQWCNDAALLTMGLTREEAWKIPLMDGKLIGLDLTHATGRSFLNQWLAYAKMGAFQGDWSDHRHDISVGAVVADRLGMKLRDDFVTMGECGEGAFVKAYGL